MIMRRLSIKKQFRAGCLVSSLPYETQWQISFFKSDEAESKVRQNVCAKDMFSVLQKQYRRNGTIDE